MTHRIVLDTNQYVSALLYTDSNSAFIVDEWQARRLELLVSPAIIEEIEKVLCYPKIKDKHAVRKIRIDTFIHQIKNQSILVPGRITVNVVAADPIDNKFIACAVEGNADFIVTGDKHLLDIGSYQGIRILTPRMFLDESSLGA